MHASFIDFAGPLLLKYPKVDLGFLEEVTWSIKEFIIYSVCKILSLSIETSACMWGLRGEGSY